MGTGKSAYRKAHECRRSLTSPDLPACAECFLFDEGVETLRELINAIKNEKL